MMWKLPPRIKILEALSCIAAGRIKLRNGEAEVVSSRGDKIYHVIWDGKRIYSDDNGSKFRGYLGYPSIAFLMLKGILPYNQKIAELLKDIPWKDWNEKYKNYRAVETKIRILLEKEGINWKEVENFIDKVINKIKELELEKLDKKRKEISLNQFL